MISMSLYYFNPNGSDEDTDGFENITQFTRWKAAGIGFCSIHVKGV